ncbi:uroporphyrinogen decarboxylase [Candidatus Magnetaquicoccus inordinatus]|uniref:uroporphyrinogen decarboxylase n=1 Tax=Candidatus Magnetaquicoccus inordinatus TaxID=2496818 RepID=UPI00102CE190|nr:uroporphyrinogen decarboxylase [Candidatus Magnetaquicoccus inordinatus]
MLNEPTHRFLRACHSLPVEQTPIWLMRQAGRYLPEYMRVRQQAGDFLALCKNPDLATEVTLQPVYRFDMDAAILFSDILVVPEAMGMSLSFGSGEGPVLEPVLRNAADLQRLTPVQPEEQLGYVLQTVTQIRQALAGRVPLIGFSGSPWTLATYMVEGGSSKTFRYIKGMLFDQPALLQQLLDQISDVVADYLNAQIAHGVQAVQIFDTWGGVLGPREFVAFSLRSIRRIVDRLQRTGADGQPVPVILFAKGCGALLEEMVATGCDVIGLDWTTDLASARRHVAQRAALQGNLDPAVLYASPQIIRQQVRRLLQDYGAHPGHIFNLGHGMAQDMDPQRVVDLVTAVREESRLLLQQQALQKG